MKFTELSLSSHLLEAIGFMGFETATPIQEMTIPEILKGNDLIACAQTGTGKTAAFLLPILDRLSEVSSHETKVMIIVPTRELAIQIDQQIHGLAYFSNVVSLAIYGGGDGTNWDQEKTALTEGADIIVATPGKILTHLKLGYVNTSKVEYLILDEADRMLDIGFHDDILKIISFLPKQRQTLMFSATMPSKIRDLAKKILTDPTEVSTTISKPAEGVLQASYLVYEQQKIELINALITDKPDYNSILIFCATKKKVAELVRFLKKTGNSVIAISSDLEQKDREEALLQFRAKNVRIVVATDVLSRGIDIKDINLIINYDVPGDAEDYVHRVGRTARAETTGVALTLVNQDDMHKFQQIEKLIEAEIIKLKVPEDLGESPEWNVFERRKQNRRFSGKRQKGKK